MKRLIVLSVFVGLAVAASGSARAQWVQTNGPFSCSIQNIAATDSAVYVTTVTGDPASSGLYFSSDQGLSWTNTGSNPANNVLFAEGKILYAASDYLGVTYSEDHGQNWDTATGLKPSERMRALCRHGAYLFALSDQAFSRSSDSGRTWERVSDSAFSPLLASRGDSLFSCKRNRLYRSTNDGQTWSLGGVYPQANSDISAIATLGAWLYIGTSYGMIYRSQDGGNNWLPYNDGIPQTYIRHLIVFDTTLFASIENGVLYRRTDSGWMIAQRGIPDGYLRPLAANRKFLFAGTDFAGVFRLADDSLEWQEINSGLSGLASVNALTSLGHQLFAGQSGMLSYSDDKGKNWIETPLAGVSTLLQTSSVLLAAGYSTIDSGVILQSKDNGLSWESASNGLDGSVSSLVSDGSTFFAAAETGHNFVSTDVFNGWSAESCPIFMPQLFSHGHNVYAAAYGNIALTSDGGATWAPIDTPAWLPNRDLEYQHPMAIVEHDNYLFASYEYTNSLGNYPSQLFRTSDFGKSWVEIKRGLPTVSTFFSIGSNLFMGLGAGAWCSHDDGINWVDVSLGLPSAATSFCMVDSDLYVGTYQHGVWHRPLNEMIGQNVVIESPTNHDGVHTFPNPLSQSTQITFTPESAGHAEISILNLLGTEVQHLFSGELAATSGGEHTFTWNPSPSLPDGMYECLIHMNGHVERVPMMLVR